MVAALIAIFEFMFLVITVLIDRQASGDVFECKAHKVGVAMFV